MGEKRRRQEREAAANARYEEIQRELADPDSETSRSVRGAQRARNAVLLGGLLPVIAAVAATGVWLVPLSWAALLTGIVFPGLAIVTGLAAGLLIFGPKEKPPRRDLFIAAVGEAIRLGLVTLLGAGRDEAIWFALGSQLASGLMGAILGASLFVVSHTDPIGKAGAKASAWTILVRTTSELATEVGLTLLVAWTPWLVLATIPATTASSRLNPKLGSPVVAPLLCKLAIGATALTIGLLLNH